MRTTTFAILLLAFSTIYSQPSRAEFEELIKDEGKLDFLICTSAISFFSSDKSEMMKIQSLVKDTNIDEIRRNPSKAFEKMVMKASVECMEEVKERSKEAKLELIGKIMKQEKSSIEELVSFDDGIFRFGGDLELTPAENKIKEEMMRMKNQYEEKSKEPKGRPGMDGMGGMGDMGDIESLKRRREKMTKDLEKRMEDLKSSRNRSLYFFGFMFIVIIVVLAWQCFGGRGADKFEMDEEMIKASDIIKEREVELQSEVRKLRRMRRALKKKLLEAGMDKEEVKQLEKSESDEEEEESMLRNRNREQEESD